MGVNTSGVLLRIDIGLFQQYPGRDILCTYPDGFSTALLPRTIPREGQLRQHHSEHGEDGLCEIFHIRSTAHVHILLHIIHFGGILLLQLDSVVIVYPRKLGRNIFHHHSDRLGK